MSVPTCAWCAEAVDYPGSTCDLDCYALWWAWHYEHGDVMLVSPGGRLIALEDQDSPVDIRSQPWYADMMDTVKEGAER